MKRKTQAKSSTGTYLVVGGLIGIVVVLVLVGVLMYTQKKPTTSAYEQYLNSYAASPNCNLQTLTGYATVIVDKIIGEEHKVYPSGGQQVFLQKQGSEIYALPYNGSNLCRVTDYFAQANTSIEYARLSPDGTKVVTRLAMWQDEIMEDIVMWDIPSQTMTNLTTQNNTHDGNPTWSLDGTWIYFESQSAGNPVKDLFRIRLDGSEQQNISNTPDRHEYNARLSVDGSHFVFQGIAADSTAYYDFYSMRSDGTERKRLTSNMIQGFEGLMLHDGRILFSAHLQGSDGMYLTIMNSDGSNIQKLSTERINAQFQAYTGDAVLYTNLFDLKPAIYQLNLNTLEITTVFTR